MAAIVSAASARMLQSIGDRIFFSTSDDNVMMDQILSTHSPDGRKFHVQPLSLIIEDVMHRSNAPLLGTIISTTHRVQCNIVTKSITKYGFVKVHVLRLY